MSTFLKNGVPLPAPKHPLIFILGRNRIWTNK